MTGRAYGAPRRPSRPARHRPPLPAPQQWWDVSFAERRPGRAAEVCATPRADVLVMETTFGRPHYVFPPTETVLQAIAAFCHDCLEDGDTPVLFGYSLGKSQEVMRALAPAGLPLTYDVITLTART